MRAPMCIAAIVAAVVVTATSSGSIAAQTKSAPQADAVSVTVKYTGKGEVDAKHQLWVWLFEDPNIGAASIPIAERSLDKNGGTATFTNVSAKQVYVAVAYDEGGGFQGNAPPPPGSPIALYGAKGPDGSPQALTPGPKARVTMTFNDAQRMQ